MEQFDYEKTYVIDYNKIIELRKKMGKNRNEVALDTFISGLTRIEQGLVSANLSNTYKLAKYFNIPMEELMVPFTQKNIKQK